MPAASAAEDKEEQAFAHFVAAAEAAAEARTQELDDVDSDADRVADLKDIEGEVCYLTNV